MESDITEGCGLSDVAVLHMSLEWARTMRSRHTPTDGVRLCGMSLLDLLDSLFLIGCQGVASPTVTVR